MFFFLCADSLITQRFWIFSSNLKAKSNNTKVFSIETAEIEEGGFEPKNNNIRPPQSKRFALQKQWFLKA